MAFWFMSTELNTTQNNSEICQATDPEVIYSIEYRRSQKAIGIIEFTFIPFVMGGNVLVIASVAIFKHMRSHFKVILVNLAVADMLVGVLVLPMHGITFIYPDLIICHKHFVTR